MNTTRRMLWPLLLFFLLGCTSFKGLEAVSPKVGNPNHGFTRVDSLQPTLQWTESKEKGVTYDLVIYEGIKTEDFWKGRKRFVGERVYYKEGLKTNAHQLEVTLKADTEYYWSVRSRVEDKVSEWAVYDYTLFLGTAYMHASNLYFTFITPKE